jgi:hypothetical protein
MPSFKFASDADTNDSTADDKKIASIHYESRNKKLMFGNRSYF